MDSTWTLHEATFRPAEIKEIFGIAPGTQLQWRARGFLGPEKYSRGAVTIAALASFLFLQDCSKRKVALEVASSVSDAVSASARRHVITSLTPLPFHGSRSDQREYEAWQARNALVETNIIDAALGSDEAHGARYVVIEAERAYPIALGGLSELEDNPRNSPINRLVTDCWAIGELIKAIPDKELVWLSR